MVREAIIKQLEERKISKRRCALDNDLNYNNFNKFLNGERNFPLSDIEKVLNYLELEISEAKK